MTDLQFFQTLICGWLLHAGWALAMRLWRNPRHLDTVIEYISEDDRTLVQMFTSKTGLIEHVQVALRGDRHGSWGLTTKVERVD